MSTDEPKREDCSHDEQQEGLQVPLDQVPFVEKIIEMTYIRMITALEDKYAKHMSHVFETHMDLAKQIVGAQQELVRKFDELTADFGILRDRVAMLDGCFTDDEDDFWHDLYEKWYQKDDYEAFVAAKGPHLAKLDIIERAGMMEEFKKVAEDLTSRD